MPNTGWGEIMVILLIALIVVGPQKLPELARSLGRAVRQFRRMSTEAQNQIREAIDLDVKDLNPFASGPVTKTVTPARVNEAASIDLGPPRRVPTEPLAIDLGPPRPPTEPLPVDLGPALGNGHQNPGRAAQEEATAEEGPGLAAPPPIPPGQ